VIHACFDRASDFFKKAIIMGGYFNSVFVLYTEYNMQTRVFGYELAD
jgi:hypothetical protein